MNLSDIKFVYTEKINKIDSRIEKYEDIIKKYNIQLNKPNKTGIERDNESLIKVMADYEHKIINMEKVKEYYKEFVNTSDFLLQNLNNNDSALWIAKYNHLLNNYNDLKTEKNSLERTNENLDAELKITKDLYSWEQEKTSKLKDNKKENEILKIDNDLLKKEIKDLKKSRKLSETNNAKIRAQRRKLEKENKTLENEKNKLISEKNELKHKLELMRTEDKRIRQELVGVYNKIVYGAINKAKLVKQPKNQGLDYYVIIKDGENIKWNTNKSELINWFKKEYPNDLLISEY